MVGGKGHNLIHLGSAGFPVPPGFVVTAAAYRLFAESTPWLAESLDEFAYASAERLRGQCAALRARLAEAPLPLPVAQAVREAMRRLDGEETKAFAVRSSSTLEDLARAAFAGQHDTFLNIRGTEDVLRRIRDCFVSLWGDRAVLYRHHQGFAQQQAHMAVVVQEQVFCDRAGVGFSINPVTGQLNRLVIDANYGLGESVVSGECEVRSFRAGQGHSGRRCTIHRAQGADGRPRSGRRAPAAGPARAGRSALPDRRGDSCDRRTAHARRGRLRLAARHRMGVGGRPVVPAPIAAP